MKENIIPKLVQGHTSLKSVYKIQSDYKLLKQLEGSARLTMDRKDCNASKDLQI
jgi:hypothetical protein